MDILKKISKTLLFISVILILGQVEVSHKTLGQHFLFNMETGSRWAGRQILHMKWFAGIEVPQFIKKWLEEEPAPAPKKRVQLLPSLPKIEEEISKSDREAMLQLLKE